MRVFMLVLVLMVPGSAYPADFLYVTMGDDAVVKYDVSLSTSAAVEASLQVFANTNLSNPRGLAFDSSGNLYVANRSTNSISKFSPSGSYLSSITSNMNLPVQLAIDPSGAIYVSNRASNTISKFSSSGVFLSSITSNLSDPRGIAFDSSGNLHVANFSGNTISKFSPSGSYLSSYGSPPDQLNGPDGIAFDSSGNLHVANFSGNTISKFSSSGSYLSSIGISTSTFFRPFGIAFDPSGNLYVANSLDFLADTFSISKFNSSGVFQFRWLVPAQPRYLAFVPEPSTYILGTLAALTLAILARRQRRTALPDACRRSALGEPTRLGN